MTTKSVKCYYSYYVVLMCSSLKTKSSAAVPWWSWIQSFWSFQRVQNNLDMKSWRRTTGSHFFISARPWYTYFCCTI